MGTINYGTSKRLCTIGYDLDANAVTEKDIADYMDEYDVEYDEAERDLDDNFYCNIENCFSEVEKLLQSELPHQPEHYTATVENGYYEGFYIRVDIDCDILGHYDHDVCNRELTKIVEVLTKCIKEYGLRVVHPGWCTTYEHGKADSIKFLKAALKEEREYIKHLKDIE